MRKARGGGTCPSKSRRQKNLTYILNDEKFRKWTFPLFEKSEWNHHLKESFVTPKISGNLVSLQEQPKLPEFLDPGIPAPGRSWKRTKSAGWFSPCLYMAQSKIHWLTVALNTYITCQHLPRGANETLRDGKLAPFRNHLAPFGRSRSSYAVYHRQNIEIDRERERWYIWTNMETRKNDSKHISVFGFYISLLEGVFIQPLKRTSYGCCNGTIICMEALLPLCVASRCNKKSSENHGECRMIHVM